VLSENPALSGGVFIFDYSAMQDFRTFEEEFKLKGRELVDKISELIHEGNVRRIVIRDDHGRTFMEIPLSLAAIGAVIAPILAAVGALAAAVSHFSVVVVRVDEKDAPPPGNSTAG
jgi:hypothetical protein